MSDWIRETCERARARFDRLSPGARPVVTRPPEAERAERDAATKTRVTLTETVPAPDYVAPTGQQLQPGAFYEATVDPHGNPSLRRIGLHYALGTEHLRRALRERNREYGRVSTELGKARLEIEALRARRMSDELIELRQRLGLKRGTTDHSIVKAALERIAAIQGGAS